MADINQEIEQIVAEMREVGKQAAPCKGGNYNNLLRYNELRERILSKFLEVFDTGGRLEMPTLTLPNEWVKMMEAINNAAVAYIEGGPYENDLPGMEFALKIDRLSRDFVRPPEGEGKPTEPPNV